MDRVRHSLKLCVVLLVLAVFAVLFAACGGTSDQSSASGSAAPSASASGASGSADLGGYTGPDAPYVTTLAEPSLQSGYTFKVGYLNPFAGISTLKTIQTSCEQQVKAMGGKFIAFDAGLDVQKQVSQMNQLISMKVDLIYAYPVSAASLTQPVADAKAAGIPVIYITTPADPSKVDSELGQAQMNVGFPFDLGDYTTMKYIADTHPGAKIGLVGFAGVAESLLWIIDREKYWAEQLGLNLVGTVDALDASPNAATVAAQSILAKYPDVQVVLGYDDNSTMAALAAVKASGKTSVLCASPNGGEEIAAQAIKAGGLMCSYDYPWADVGTQAAYAGYDILTKQNLPLPVNVLLAGTLATKDNVDQLVFVK